MEIVFGFILVIFFIITLVFRNKYLTMSFFLTMLLCGYLIYNIYKLPPKVYDTKYEVFSADIQLHTYNTNKVFTYRLKKPIVIVEHVEDYPWSVRRSYSYEVIENEN